MKKTNDTPSAQSVTKSKPDQQSDERVFSVNMIESDHNLPIDLIGLSRWKIDEILRVNSSNTDEINHPIDRIFEYYSILLKNNGVKIIYWKWWSLRFDDLKRVRVKFEEHFQVRDSNLGHEGFDMQSSALFTYWTQYWSPINDKYEFPPKYALVIWKSAHSWHLWGVWLYQLFNWYYREIARVS